MTIIVAINAETNETVGFWQMTEPPVIGVHDGKWVWKEILQWR